MDRQDSLFVNRECRSDRVTRVQHCIELSTGKFLAVPEEDAPLRGSGRRRYLRIPKPVALVLGPVLGALYVLLLPFVGIIMILVLAARRIARILADGSRSLAMIFGMHRWAPGRSYLTPRSRNIRKRANKSNKEYKWMSSTGEKGDEG